MSTAVPQKPLLNVKAVSPDSLAFKILMPVLAVFLATGLALYTLHNKRLEEQALNNLRSQLEVFTDNKAVELSEPLWSFRDDVIESLMRSYKDHRDLYKIALYDKNGVLLHQEGDAVLSPRSKVIKSEKTLTHKMGDEDIVMGRLEVKFHNTHLLQAMDERRAADVGPILVLLIVVGTAAWFIIYLTVGKPLHDLKMSLINNATKEERIPLVWESNDELGQVVREYNRLLREVEDQTARLVKNNSILERQIVQRKAAERQLEKAHSELESIVEIRTMALRQANEELLELDKQRSNFLSCASHELRTPLAAVLGFSRLVRKSFAKHFEPIADEHDLEDRARTILSNLDIIGREGDRLTRLINDLLDINNIEAGHMEWRDTLLNPSDEIRRAAKTMAPSFSEESGVRLALDVPDILPPLHFDPDRMQQLLINLLSNASKHTKVGEVRMAAGQSNGFVRITVADTGEGIPPEEQELIFKKFYQRQNAREGKPLGTGLGLAICRTIAEHYSGTISVESEEGRGSVFIVDLPTAARN